MAQYDVTHACGHTRTHRLFGKHTERDRRIAWLKTVDCADCYRAAQASASAKAASEIAANAGVDALPALVGSDKQIAWATTLRTARLKGLTATGLKSDLLPKIVAAAAGKADCRWWIDHKGLTDRDVAIMLAKETGAVE